MDAGDYNLEIFRGRARTWWAQLFQDDDGTDPVDLTGCTPVAGIRLADGTTLELAAEVVDEEVDGEVIAPTDGWIKVSITAEQSATLAGSYYTWSAGILDTLNDWNPALEGAARVKDDPTADA